MDSKAVRTLSPADFILSLMAGGPVELRNIKLPGFLETHPDQRNKALYPPLYRELLRLGHENIPEALRLGYYANLRRSAIFGQQAGETVLLLRDNGIPCMEIKGQDLEKRIYPVSGTRFQADIDLLVPGGAAEAVKALLCARGYRFIVGDSTARIFVREGVQFDLHTELFGYQTQVLIGKNYASEALIRPEGLPLSLYFLLTCMQYFLDGTHRHVPALDLYFWAAGHRYEEFTDLEPGAAACALFAFQDLKRRCGFSPLGWENLGLWEKRAGLAEKIARFTRSPRSRKERLAFLLFHSERRFSKLLGILFPPSRVVREASYVGSRWGYLKRALRNILRKG
jgi:hypothetical protein